MPLTQKTRSLTVNQVLNRLKELAEAHKQIKEFRIGDVVDVLSESNASYPLLLADFTTGSISKSGRLTTFDFEFWFCDLLHVADNSRENETELFSDLTSIAQDFKAMLEFNDFNDWEIGDVAQLQYYREKFEDVTLAIKMTVSISVWFDSNRCAIPTDYQFESAQEYRVLATEGGDIITDEDGREFSV